jgi:4-amino-4-deoxy-L-arabinose transferase-like glycosyltransferase
MRTDRGSWRRFGWFLFAGTAGYAVNLAIYAASIDGGGLDYRVAAGLAFAFALATTFALNRRFTFAVRGGAVAGQAWRYLVVSLVAFGANIAVLHGLVAGAGMAKLIGQAVAVGVAAPVNYAGQRLWAFAPEHEPAEQTRPRALWAALGAIVAGGAFLRFWHLGMQGLWWDEATSGWLLRGGLGHVAPAVARTESTPPLYYLTAWCWTHVFGSGAVGLRSLSATAGALTVPAAFLAGRTFVSDRVGLVVAGLVAVNPFLVWYSQEARAYAMLALLTTVALWLFARVRARPTAARHVVWGLSASLALFTHYFAFFAIVPQALLLLGDRRIPLRRRVAGPAVAAVTGAALLSLVSRQTGAHALWFTHIGLGRRIGQLFPQYLVGFTPPAPAFVIAVAVAAVLAALALLAARGDTRERSTALVAGVIAVIAVGVPVVMAVLGADFLDTRNVIAGVVPAALVVACGLGARRAGRAGPAVAAVLALVSVAMVGRMVDSPSAQRTHWNQVAAALQRPANSPPRIILTESPRAWERSLGFYMPHMGWLGHRTARVAEIDVVRRLQDPHPCPHIAWWGPACHILPNAHRDHHLGALGFRLAGTRSVAGFRIARWVPASGGLVPVHAPIPGGGKLILTPSKVQLL